MAGKDQHYDDGLAHDDAIHPGLVRMLHLDGHSFEMIRRSKECVITSHGFGRRWWALATAPGINVDKSEKFGLTPGYQKKLALP